MRHALFSGAVALMIPLGVYTLSTLGCPKSFDFYMVMFGIIVMSVLGGLLLASVALETNR